MVKETEFYDRLGVAPDAPEEEIRRAYKKAALRCHPDRNPDDPSAKERFQHLGEAFEVLSDSEKRQLYDQYGADGLKENGPGMNPDEIFSQFFGGGLGSFFSGRGRGEARERRGEDIVHGLTVKLEDLYKGKTTKLQLTKSVLCAACKGKGSEKDGAVKKCTGCRGQGVRIVMRQIGPGMIQQMQVACPDCKGAGEMVDEKDRCTACKGQKTSQEKKVLEVFIEPGMSNNEKIVFRGEADQAPGVVPGDIVIVVREAEHASFKRQGTHLFMEKSINLFEALCGFEFIVEHLDGRKLLIKNRPGDVIKPGDSKVVLNEGMPTRGSPFEKGNLVVKFNILFPPSGSITPKQIEQLRAILPAAASSVKYNASEVEECKLHDYNEAAHQARGARREAYHDGDDDDDDDSHPRQQQCQMA